MAAPHGGSAAAAAPSTPAVGDNGDGKASDFLYLGTKIDGAGRSHTATSTSARATASCCGTSTRAPSSSSPATTGAVNAEKTYARINSLTDIQELVTASKDLSVSFQRQRPLVLRIAQDDGTLGIALPGLADDYKSTFDDNLF